MKRIILAVAIALPVCLSGCSYYDAFFNVFGDYYSGGGYSRFEKEADYEEHVRSYGADKY